MKILLNFMLLLLLSCGQNTAVNELAESSKEYDIQDLLIQTRDGGRISGIVARKKGDQTKKAVLLQYTIYVRDKGRDVWGQL